MTSLLVPVLVVLGRVMPAEPEEHTGKHGDVQHDTADDSGTTVAQALAATGLAGPTPPAPRHWACLIEPHIEQGPILENEHKVIGVVESLSVFYLPDGFKDTAAYIVVLIMLMVMPNGLFGETTRKKV